MLQPTTCNGMQLIASLVSKLRALEPPMASLGVALVSADVERGAQAAKSTRVSDNLTAAFHAVDTGCLLRCNFHVATQFSVQHFPGPSGNFKSSCRFPLPPTHRHTAASPQVVAKQSGAPIPKALKALETPTPLLLSYFQS